MSLSSEGLAQYPKAFLREGSVWNPELPKNVNSELTFLSPSTKTQGSRRLQDLFVSAKVEDGDRHPSGIFICFGQRKLDQILRGAWVITFLRAAIPLCHGEIRVQPDT